MNKLKGFTLIELLVVIAIIGVLSAVVLAALGNSRDKGVDAKIKSQMGSLRSATEIYAVNNGNQFLAAANCTSGLFASPTGNIANIMTSINSLTSAEECTATVSAWSVAVRLTASSTTYWCADSIGISRSQNATGVPYGSLSGGANPAHASASATACN